MARKTLMISLALLGWVWLGNVPARAQEKQYRVGCIAFYNLENLFDTVNDPLKNDEEYLPAGKNEWNSGKYLSKLRNMAQVIPQIGDEMISGGPVLIGVSEIENRKVLEDLVKTPPMDQSGYEIVHYDSPDRRGVDVGLLYRKDHFTVTHTASLRLSMPDRPDWFTRDQLVVSGLLDGEPIHVIVNHWPSRSGGEAASAPLRDAAARLTRSIVDSLMNKEPGAKIVVMGDLNDNPTDNSLLKELRAQKKPEQTGKKDLFNPMYRMYVKEGLGSLAYRDSWSLFDQIIISGALLGDDSSTFKFWKAKVFNRPFLAQKEGAFKGYPDRTHAAGVYLGGYSDHFPVYIFLLKEKK